MNKMRVLVAVANYPNNSGGILLMYVHTRNKYYIKKGIDVTVLNFSAKADYQKDGIRVITLSSYKKEKGSYDILICHAPNIRNHYLFLKKYGDDFRRIIFFFHGHEVLKKYKVYPAPFDYVHHSKTKIMLRNIYDDIKLGIWHNYLPKLKEKSFFIFVSKWMLDEFLKWTGIDFQTIQDRYEVTYNSIGESFENTVFSPEKDKEFDFITIRGSLDGSKYGIDIVNRIAKNNPDYRFLVIGKGNYFSHYKKADNVYWINNTLNHNEIIEYIQKSKYGLMPTRTDAQGLMACEMASTGMPLITSNIPVCHEIFSGFNNVCLIDNESNDIKTVVSKFEKESPYEPNSKYYKNRTCDFEVSLLNKVFNS